MLTMCHAVVFNLAGQTCYRRTAEGCGSLPSCAILHYGKGHCNWSSEKPGGAQAYPGTRTAKPHSSHLRVPGIFSQVRSRPLLNNDGPSRAELSCCHPSVSAFISPGQPCPGLTCCTQPQWRPASERPLLGHPTAPPQEPAIGSQPTQGMPSPQVNGNTMQSLFIEEIHSASTRNRAVSIEVRCILLTQLLSFWVWAPSLASETEGGIFKCIMRIYMLNLELHHTLLKIPSDFQCNNIITCNQNE